MNFQCYILLFATKSKITSRFPPPSYFPLHTKIRAEESENPLRPKQLLAFYFVWSNNILDGISG